MSENLDLVRSIYADWERGDWTSASWAHPDIEFVFADGPSPGSFTGVAAMARTWRDYMSDWRDVRADAKEFREIDSERVLVLLDFIGRGRASGVEVARARSRGANLFHIRDGTVTRLVLHFDRDRALADLGLEA
jgi:ketosteroid isomerase-like protein